MPPAHPAPWRQVDNQDELADEVLAYGEARRLLRVYARLLQQLFRHRRASDVLAAADALAAAIARLSPESDLMRGSYAAHQAGLRPPPWVTAPWVWQFHAAYLAFSETDERSRSWLLAALGERGWLLRDLASVRNNLTERERANRAFEGTYERTAAAIAAWRALAQPRLRVPQAALRAREERPRSRHAQLTHLLQQLERART
jgi:hypothetical protein